MKKTTMKASKTHRGVYTYDGPRGKTFYIKYKVNGRQVKQKVGSERDGCSQAEAAQIRAETLRRLRRRRQDLPLDPSDYPTFGSLAKKWLAHTSELNSTGTTDQQRFDKHLEPRFASLRADLVDSAEVTTLKRELISDGLAPATVNRVLALMRAIFNHGTEKGLIDFPNPVSRADMLDEDNQSQRYLSAEEIVLLFDALRKKSPTIYGLALLSYSTSSRFGEVARVRWRDVDLTARRVTLWITKGGRKGAPRVPKSCQLTADAFDFLNSLDRGGLGDLVFTDRQGRQYQQPPHGFRSTADSLFNKGVEERCDRVTFHTLRHTAATHIAAGGAGAVTLRDALGHKTLAMANRYAKRADEALARAYGSLPSVRSDSTDEGSENN